LQLQLQPQLQQQQAPRDQLAAGRQAGATAVQKHLRARAMRNAR
jgi:hypothetical protein